MNINWEEKIASLIRIKEKLTKSHNCLLEQFKPETPTKEEELEKLENELDFSIDENYREFLKCANGWKNLFLSMNLFGTSELMGNELEKYTNLLSVMDDAGGLIGISTDELLVIAASEIQGDVFAITKPCSRNPGIVIWYAGYEIERYNNFIDFFNAMIEYNIQEVED